MGIGPIRHHKPVTDGGFTIVELLIVLGIAGFILLLIFQAIPALQRNSHNGQRKQDVAAILQAVSRFQLNNSARFPSDCSATELNCSALKLYQYEATDIHIVTTDTAGSATTPVPAITDGVILHQYYKCQGGVAKQQGAGSRDIVAVYAIEGAGADITPQCQQL